MAERRTPSQMVAGDIRFVSRMFSNLWYCVYEGTDLAEMRRYPGRHVSEVTIAGGTTYRLEPQGWGTVVAVEGGSERGRVIRRSWWGRAWDLVSTTFGYALTSDPLPRRWTLRVGEQPVGRLAGTPFSYNRLQISTDVAVPILPLVLSWHVLARPWEAAASPGALVAHPVPRYPGPGTG